MKPLHTYIVFGVKSLFKVFFYLWLSIGGVITLFALLRYVQHGFQPDDFLGILSCLAVLGIGAINFFALSWFFKNFFNPSRRTVATEEDIEHATQVMYGPMKDDPKT
ncbi:hypothetical protein OVA03_13330 [Asticcacaulis sp. SL142]|uniref:hypothetical protein n=1 Tax=Asticcacaulis sp. SL142 TaxID=2995155 RepID=UPI00226C849D|nr:hypothetical protein [Asticcacaulis sp. SL142]WAC47677.1 hypothetical protein OVA03_13330 [Asticcacaulis sp. SL142]